MVRRAALTILVALLGGCNVHSNPAGADGNVSVEADNNGDVSFNLPFVKGQVKLPQGTFKNGDFDIDGVKMIPGGTIHGFSMTGGDKGAIVNVAFNAPDSPEKVRAYFVDQFKQKGVAASEVGDAISGRTRDGDTFVIKASSAGQGSEGTVVIQSKD